jgi:hypothetical protein
MGRPLIKKAFSMNITKNIACLDIIMIYVSEANFSLFSKPFFRFWGVFRWMSGFGGFLFLVNIELYISYGAEFSGIPPFLML